MYLTRCQHDSTVPSPFIDGALLMQSPTMHVESQTMYVEVAVASRITWVVRWENRLDEKDTIKRRWPHSK